MNDPDKQHRARMHVAKLKEAAHAEAIELGPSIVGALEGLAAQISALVSVNERMLTALDEFTLASRAVVGELALLRDMRTTTEGGH